MRTLAADYAIEIVDSAGGRLGSELVPCVDDATALFLARAAVHLFAGAAAARVCRAPDGKTWQIGDDT